jgi:serine/threonine protein kinase
MRVPLTHVLLTDFGYEGYGDEPNNHDIQTEEFVAPEVTLRAYWPYPTDIWNFGLMLFDMLGENLFNGIHSRGHFDPHIRFGQMIRVLGPMPDELYDRAHKDFRSQFFNKQRMYTSKTKLPPANILSGEFLRPRFIPDDSFNLENKASMLELIERKLFINFVKRMLKWLPEECATAKELLDDPYLSYKSPLDIEFVKPEITKPVYDGPRPSRHPHPLLRKKIGW